jgi:hypothetical protein
MAGPPYDYWFGEKQRRWMFFLEEPVVRVKREPPTSRLMLHRSFRNGKRVVTAEFRPYASKVVLKRK